MTSPYLYGEYLRFFFTEECDALWIGTQWPFEPTSEELDSALFGYWYCEVRNAS